MFQVYKNNEIITIVEEPIFIRKHPTEPWYTSASPSNATGISIQNVGIFALAGHELDGLPQVALVKVDGGNIIHHVSNATHVQSLFIASGLGVDVEISPEDTDIISISADLPPIADGQEWRAGLNLVDGTIVTYGGKNYIIRQSHISQANWSPMSAPALFEEIRNPYAPWIQPLGAHDAYMQGDRATHNGKLWKSDINFNIWEPGVHGWTEVK